MLKSLSIGAGLALFAISTPGAAAQPVAANGDDRVVCKEQSTPNSRFTRKDCRTVKEWRQAKEMFRAAIEKRQRDSMQNTCIYSGAGAVCS